MTIPHNIPTLLIDQKRGLKVAVNDIILLRGDINYTKFIFQHIQKCTVSHSLKYFEEVLLINGFLRIHRSYLVNSKFIKSTNLDSLTVTLMDGTELKVARRRVKTLKNY